MEDLEGLKEQEIITIGLNIGEKKRVKLLISSLHEGNDICTEYCLGELYRS